MVIFDTANTIRRPSMLIKFIHPYCYTILSYAILYSPLFVLQIEYITWKIWFRSASVKALTPVVRTAWRNKEKETNANVVIKRKEMGRICLPVPTLIYLWEICIFPGSVCLFCCRELVDWSWELVMATLAKRKQTKASIMVFSSISKRSEHLR